MQHRNEEHREEKVFLANTFLQWSSPILISMDVLNLDTIVDIIFEETNDFESYNDLAHNLAFT